MKSRRDFLGSVLASGAGAALLPGGLERVLAAARAVDGRDPEDVARDEDFWREVQLAFPVDRNLTNLNNGGVSPSPRVVLDAQRRYLEESNHAPVVTMWRHLEPQIEVVRARLAKHFGCDAEEIAITRNASEALETVIFGLELKPGDEVVISDQNYPRMIHSWRQRERRSGIVVKEIRLPVGPEDPMAIVEAFQAAVTPKTRVIEFPHVINWHGQIVPVRELCRFGRERGIEVIVDGAHAFAHFPFTRADLECDFFGTSLHKWLHAPHGTGMLYVRRERIKDVWPLMAADPELDQDIRKFEEIGTHPAAGHNAIGEALTFHEGIGVERKAARLRHLSRHWMKQLEGRPRVRVLPRDDPAQSCGLRLLQIEGLDVIKAAGWLIEKPKIVVSPIEHEDFEGLRVTPSVYTTLSDLDRFVEAIDFLLRNGIPPVRETPRKRKRR